MMNMSNLPRDLVEEILSRTPLTSMRAVRSTCKNWNTLSKDGSFTKKHLAQAAAATAKEGEFLAIVLINFSLYLMSVNLNGIYTDSDSSVKPRGKLISLNDSDQLHFIQVYHCEGLVLCTATDYYTRLVVWNPYSGQTRWISVESRSVHHLLSWYAHALGYDQSKSYKILRFAHPPEDSSVHEIFELNSNSWTVLDVTPDWRVWQSHHGLSLKGNTYWFATDKESRGHVPDFLLCFDFTKERFGPRLPLPFASFPEDAVTLSSLREEQLAVLFQSNDTFEMEIWVTSMIEPNAVSWSKFFAIDMEPLTCFRFYDCGTFLIDEEKRAVVVFDEDNDAMPPTRDIAYVIGENGYFRQVDLGEITTNIDGHPLACSYVPSSVRID